MSTQNQLICGDCRRGPQYSVSMGKLLEKTILAGHVAIGSELTSGQTLNTNSKWIAEQLQIDGVKSQVHIVVPDEAALILNAFDVASKECDWLFIYGGLGPTSDDFTRNMVSQWTGKELVLNDSVWSHIQSILNSRGYPIRDFQKQQAFFPEGAHIMENLKGTAHGFHVTAKGKEIFVLPGPPIEVRSVFENYLKNWVNKNSGQSDAYVTEIWNTMGLGESEIAFRIENLVKNYNVTVGYRVHLPYVEVKISFLKSEYELNRSLVDAVTAALESILIYKNQYPYPEYFKRLLDSYVSISLIDEATQGGILNDFRQWVPDWEKKQIAFYNQAAACVFTRGGIERAMPIIPGHLLFSITRSSADNMVWVFLSSETLNVRIEFSIQSLAKLPPERQPLNIKEMIYQRLLLNSPT